MWQQLEFASELESDCKKLSTGAGSGLLVSMQEKANLFRLTGLISPVPLI